MDGSTGNHLTRDISSVIVSLSNKRSMTTTLLPGLLSLCFNTIVLCETTPVSGKNYDYPEKSCYVDGVFYKKCRDYQDD